MALFGETTPWGFCEAVLRCRTHSTVLV